MQKRTIAGLLVAAFVTAGLESKDFHVPKHIALKSTNPNTGAYQETRREVYENSVANVKSYVVDPLAGILAGAVTIGAISLLNRRHDNDQLTPTEP